MDTANDVYVMKQNLTPFSDLSQMYISANVLYLFWLGQWLYRQLGTVLAYQRMLTDHR